MKRLHNLFAVLALAFFGLTACEYAEDPTTDVWQPATISTPQQAITIAMNGADIQTGKSLKVVWKAGHMGISAPVKTSLLLVDGDNEKGKVLESSVQTKWHKELQVSYQALNQAAAQMGAAFGTAKNLKLVVKAEAEGKQPLYSAPVGFSVTTFNMPEPVWTAPAVTAPTDGQVLEMTAANLGSKVAMSFLPKQTGVFTPVKFEVIIASGEATKVVGEVTALDLVSQTVEVTNKVLNDFVVAQGAKDKEVRDVQVTVKATHALLKTPLVSAPVVFKVKAFVPSILYMVGNLNDWAGDSPVLMTYNKDNNDFSKIAYMEGEFLFTTLKDKDNWWREKYGKTATAGKLAKFGGDNIVVPAAGFFKAQANIEALTYSLTPITWGVIGSATAGGWDTDTNMTFDAATKTYSVTMDLNAGAWKVRFADDWALSVGPDAGGDFQLAEGGNYTITLTYKGAMPLDPFNYTGGYEVKIVKN